MGSRASSYETLDCERILDHVRCMVRYVHKTVMDNLKVTHISAGFDCEAVLVDESSPSVLKYRTPKFR